MKTVLTLILTMALVGPLTVWADEASHRADIEQILVYAHFPEKVGTAFDSYEAKMEPEKREQMASSLAKLREAMTWENIKDEIAGIFMDVISEDEAKAFTLLLQHGFKEDLMGRLHDKQDDLGALVFRKMSEALTKE